MIIIHSTELLRTINNTTGRVHYYVNSVRCTKEYYDKVDTEGFEKNSFSTSINKFVTRHRHCVNVYKLPEGGPPSLWNL